VGKSARHCDRTQSAVVLLVGCTNNVSNVSLEDPFLPSRVSRNLSRFFFLRDAILEMMVIN
jgi:hypothetical protein